MLMLFLQPKFITKLLEMVVCKKPSYRICLKTLRISFVRNDISYSAQPMLLKSSVPVYFKKKMAPLPAGPIKSNGSIINVGVERIEPEKK